MTYKTVQAKSYEEAIKNSGLYVGQPARITKLNVSGQTDGTWTVIPEFEVVEEQPSEEPIYDPTT